MNKAQAKLLVALAKKLESLPRERFYYGSFCDSEWDAEHLCGTTACALGWAGTMPVFQRRGLLLGEDEYGSPRLFTKGLRGIGPWEAAATILGLTTEEVDFLFEPSYPLDARPGRPRWMSPGSDASAKEVAKHIRRFVKFKGHPEVAKS